MNILILSANTGQGHNSCSEAVKEEFEARGSSCDICDSLAFVSRAVSRFVVKVHIGSYKKVPQAFGWGYRVSERHPQIFGRRSPIYFFFKKGAKKLEAFIEEKGYDIVIACHVFAAVILSEAKKGAGKQYKTAFVATDYTRSPGVDQSCLDHYFIPDDSLTDEFTTGQITKDKLCASGIPVKKEYFSSADKAAAKELLCTDKNSLHLIVMCGSMGCGPIKEIAFELERELKEDCEASIICGSNEKLRKYLLRKFSKNERFHIYGYVDNVSLFMDSADLYLTKPGGISVCEAAAKRLPMVFVDAVSGCETYNRNFFADAKGALCEKSPKELARACAQLLSDEKRRAEMAAALSKLYPQNPAKKIYEVLAL